MFNLLCRLLLLTSGMYFLYRSYPHLMGEDIRLSLDEAAVYMSIALTSGTYMVIDIARSIIRDLRVWREKSNQKI